MNTEEIVELSSTEQKANDSSAVADQAFDTLIAQYGRDCFRLGRTFTVTITNGLAKFPAHAKSLNAAITTGIVMEVAAIADRSQSEDELIRLGNKLSRTATIEKSLALWAVQSWYRCIFKTPSNLGKMQFTKEMKAKIPHAENKTSTYLALTSAIIIGLVCFVVGTIVEFSTIYHEGPTNLEYVIARIKKPEKQRFDEEGNAIISGFTRDEELTGMTAVNKFGLYGMLLYGVACGIGGYCGWALSGGTYKGMLRGCILSAGMTVLSSIFIFTTKFIPILVILVRIPIVNEFVHMIMMGAMIFFVAYRCGIRQNFNDVENAMTNSAVNKMQNFAEI